MTYDHHAPDQALGEFIDVVEAAASRVIPFPVDRTVRLSNPSPEAHSFVERYFKQFAPQVHHTLDGHWA